MVTKDDTYIFQETLAKNIEFFSKIYVLDGGLGSMSVESICAKYPNKILYFREDSEEFIQWIKGEEPGDYIRQFLLSKIQVQEELPIWVTLIHGDEIFWDDPQVVIQHAELMQTNLIFWDQINFFWHSSQRGRQRFEVVRPIEECQSWYTLPPRKVVRQFKYYGTEHYVADQAFEYPMIREAYPLIELDSRAIIKHYPFNGPSWFIKLKYKDSIRGNRILSLGFNWVASLLHEDSELYLDRLPFIPGIIDRNEAHNSECKPLPKTY